MNNEIIFSMVFVCGVLVSSTSQLLLKKSATQEHTSIWKEYLNIRVIVAYGVFFLVTFVNILALKYITLGQAAIYESLGYVFVIFFGVVCLKEKLNSKKLKGMMLIIMGTILFTI